MDIEAVRALTGDYSHIIMKKDNIKCYGYHSYGYDLKQVLDIGYISKDKLNIDIVADFLRNDIVLWQPYFSSSDFDVVVRKDGKTLRIARNLLSSLNNKYIELLNLAIRRSIINIIKTSDSALEVNLSNDKITIIDITTGETVLKAWHLADLDMLAMVNYLLDNTLKHTDIKINYSFDKPVNVSMMVFGTYIKINGTDEIMMPIIKICADYKENLKNTNYHQLKMKGF